MSATQLVEVDSRRFWAVSDALQVWLAYLVGAADEGEPDSEQWLAPLVAQWRRAATVSDYGVSISLASDEHRAALLRIAREARERVVADGDVPETRLRNWRILDDLVVAAGRSRDGSSVRSYRVLDVAAGFIGAVDGTLPAEAPERAWLFGGPHDGARTVTMTEGWQRSLHERGQHHEAGE